MKAKTCLTGLAILLCLAGPTTVWAADPEPASEIVIPGDAGAGPIRSVAALPVQSSHRARLAVFECRDGKHAGTIPRTCRVSLFEDESSVVAEGSPLFPGMFCSIDASMAWISEGRLGIATSCWWGRNAGVWLQVTDRSGHPLACPSLVATFDPVGPATNLLIVPRDDGAFWVVWLGGCPDRCHLMGRRYGWDGAPIGEPMAFTPPGASAFPTRPAGSALPGGDVVLAWEDEDDEGGGGGIALLRLDGSGEVVARHRLPGGDPSSSDRMPIVAATPGGCVVAWQRTWPTSNVPATVLVQRLGEDLSPAGPPLDLHSLRPEAYGFSALAIAPRGRDLLLAWRETPDPGALADLVVGRLAADGSWIGEPRQVVRPLPRHWPQLWLEPMGGDRWSLLWRQPPDDAELPHPWLRRLVVPWQDGFWNTDPESSVQKATRGGDPEP